MKYGNSFLECANIDACKARPLVRELDRTFQNGVTKNANWLINEKCRTSVYASRADILDQTSIKHLINKMEQLLRL